MLFGCLFWLAYKIFFEVCDGDCFYLQAVMEAFAMNGSVGVYDGACIYLHEV